MRHSEVKHSLLRDYLVEYFQVLVSSPRQDRIQLTVVDGFCGGGRYVNEAGEQVPGSPIVILRAIEEAQARVMHAQQRRKAISFDVKLICIDADASAIDHLRYVLNEQGYGARLQSGGIHLLQGDFVTHADAVIAEVARRSPRAGRSLFVLDQYGYDQVPVPVLKKIFCELKQAEVLLTFNVDALINYLNDKNARNFERKVGLDGALTSADMDKCKRGPGWRLRVQANLYQKITQGSGAGFFTPFFIRPERGHGDFWLLHLSQHWKARDVMASAHWTHSNHFSHYGRSGFNMLSNGYAARIDDEDRPQAAFEFDDVARASSRSAMLSEIPHALAQHPHGIAFRNFFVDRVNTTPATLAMVERAVLDLVREKEVEVVGADGGLRHVRSALQGDHVLRLAAQRPLVLLGGW